MPLRIDFQNRVVYEGSPGSVNPHQFVDVPSPDPFKKALLKAAAFAFLTDRDLKVLRDSGTVSEEEIAFVQKVWWQGQDCGQC